MRMANYHRRARAAGGYTVYGWFPNPPGVWGGSIVILPYIEQGNVTQQLDAASTVAQAQSAFTTYVEPQKIKMYHRAHPIRAAHRQRSAGLWRRRHDVLLRRDRQRAGASLWGEARRTASFGSALRADKTLGNKGTRSVISRTGYRTQSQSASVRRRPTSIGVRGTSSRITIAYWPCPTGTTTTAAAPFRLFARRRQPKLLDHALELHTGGGNWLLADGAVRPS